MIQIICKNETYSYNAYHIMKAFYPSQEIVLRVEEKASNYVTVWLPDGREVFVGPENPAKVCEGEIQEKDVKRFRDKRLYLAVSNLTKKTLPWGILTGVRPTKIAMKKLEEGWKREVFLPWFQEEYQVSAPKSRLAWEVALREKKLLEKLDCEEGYSLYVGIPFCPSVCSYCSFSSGALKDFKNRVEDYLKALLREIAFTGKGMAERKLNTIYIGGGTPTTLSAGQLEALLSCIDACFSREHLLEYTVEAGRPDSISKEKLEVLRAHNVTRISINPQSMQKKTLDAIGRNHSVEDVVSAYRLARETGFDNINMDIIAGLPGETVKDMDDTLRQIRVLGPDSLTVHALAIKRASRMEMKDMGRDTGRIACTIREMIGAAEEAAESLGLKPYYLYRQKNIAGNFENVGYAKVDKAGIYNILIMEEKQTIIGAGAGASTKMILREAVPAPGSKKGKMTHLVRLENVKAIDAYIERTDEMIERKGEWLWH